MVRRSGTVVSENPLRVEWLNGQQEVLSPALFDDLSSLGGVGERFWVLGVWGNFGLVRVVAFGLEDVRSDAGHTIWHTPEIDIG